ncbi:hypothetical protein [Streptomyces canus]|uniref:hypothetical protein n=1 Tax=Streptomyces canus TaxID=58343 RepID=UPI00036CF47F|nr:hypothetical protein [Streptomyces canus]
MNRSRPWERALDLLAENNGHGLTVESVGVFLHISPRRAQIMLDGLVSRGKVRRHGGLYRAVPVEERGETDHG